MLVISENGSPSVLFSIIIPTYNYGKLVDRAIASVLNQPGNDYEVIVIDDGSEDNTADVVAQFSERITYRYQQNQGPSAARNRGIDESCGRFLIFLDSDDQLLPDALKNFRDTIASRPEAEMLIGQFITVDTEGKQNPAREVKLSNSNLNNFLNYLKKRIPIRNGVTATHRELFDLCRFPEHVRNGEDIPVIAVSLLHCNTVVINQPLMITLSHEDSLSHNIATIRNTSFGSIEFLFDPALLPPEAMSFKIQFECNKHLSMSRSFYRSGCFAESRKSYIAAVKVQKSKALTPKYLSRFLFSYLRGFVQDKSA